MVYSGNKYLSFVLKALKGAFLSLKILFALKSFDFKNYCP